MFRALTLVLALLLVACAKGPAKPARDEAVIVFIRPAMDYRFGGRNQTIVHTVNPSVSIHDVTAGRKLVGIVTFGEKVAYRVPPGRHYFMLLTGPVTDFMEANVSGGRTYYVGLEGQVGTEAGGFKYNQPTVFRPVRGWQLEAPFFTRWNTSASLVEPTPKWTAWDAQNAASIDRRRAQRWPEWERKSAAERTANTLRVTDGQ